MSFSSESFSPWIRQAILDDIETLRTLTVGQRKNITKKSRKIEQMKYVLDNAHAVIDMQQVFRMIIVPQNLFYHGVIECFTQEVLSKCKCNIIYSRSWSEGAGDNHLNSSGAGNLFVGNDINIMCLRKKFRLGTKVQIYFREYLREGCIAIIHEAVIRIFGI